MGMSIDAPTRICSVLHRHGRLTGSSQIAPYELPEAYMENTLLILFGLVTHVRRTTKFRAHPMV